MTLGERIYQLHTRQNLSQGDLAEMLDVSRQSVSKWENDSAVPELDKLVKLSERFGVTLDEMVKGEKPVWASEVGAPEQIVTVVRREPVSGQKIAGMILLFMAFVVLLLLTVMGGLLAGVILGAPFLYWGMGAARCFEIADAAWY